MKGSREEKIGDEERLVEDRGDVKEDVRIGEAKKTRVERENLEKERG